MSETDRSTAEGEILATCVICQNAISESKYGVKAPCGHTFHKSCLAKHSKANPNCPVCNISLKALPMGTPGPPAATRSHVRSLIFDGNRPEDVNQNGASSVLNLIDIENSQDRSINIQNIVSEAVCAQQAEMLNTLSQQLNSLFQANMESLMQRLNIGSNSQDRSSPLNTAPVVNSPRHNLSLPPPSTRQPPVEVQTLEQLLGLPNTANQNSLPNGTLNANSNTSVSNITPHSHESFRPEKVGHIIHNWKLKFSGDSKGMSIDNFLYRVEALTTQTLGGNFSLLCDYISMLFDSKASDWFWSYHKRTRVIVWNDLCRALRKQYKDSRTDVDLREMIRDRKQRPNENFDSFYEAIFDISDRLSEPLDEKVLIEILRRNLLPDIQHEILNIQLNSVSQLRDICRRREFFMQDVGKRQAYPKPFAPRRQVNEILDDESVSSDIEDISAISLVCWNCNKNGHRYQDCLEDRTIFCYGCGTPKVYKPKCPKCNAKNSKSSAPSSARRQTSSTSTSTNTD